MPDIREITRESWILSTFPEWGTWLNEEIESEELQKDSFAIWWLGCTGIWFKSHKSTNILIDLWVGSGKKTKADPFMKKGHQMMRMSGCRSLQPNLRNAICPIDPFAIKNLDALLATHDHDDHMDPNVAAAVHKNCPDTPFIGPKTVVEKWVSWGVPIEKCKIVKPGDSFTIGDVEIVVLDSFDRTELVTVPNDVVLKGTMPLDMDEKAVNYLLKTDAGSLYHSGDSHYSNYYAKHGNEHNIDVALGSFGENPRGITDKMTSVDILRMAESLKVKVVIPFHHDIWTNFQADPMEVLYLYNLRKNRLDYKFKPFIWQVGGKFTYPQDKNKIEYHHPRGFDDCFIDEPDLPFNSIL